MYAKKPDVLSTQSPPPRPAATKSDNNRNESSATESDDEHGTVPAAAKRRKRKKRHRQGAVGVTSIDAAAMLGEAKLAIASLRSIYHTLSMAGQGDESDVRRLLLASLVPLVKDIEAIAPKNKPARMRKMSWRDAAVRRGVSQDDLQAYSVGKLRKQVEDSLAQLVSDGKHTTDEPFVRAFTIIPSYGHAVHYLGKDIENKSKPLNTPGWVLHNVSSATPKKGDLSSIRAAALTAFDNAKVNTAFAEAHTVSFGEGILAKNVYLGALYLDVPRSEAEIAAVAANPWRISSVTHGWMIRRAICFFQHEHDAQCYPGLPFSMRGHVAVRGTLQNILRRLSPEKPEYFFTH
jgi:hypothetical protein